MRSDDHLLTGIVSHRSSFESCIVHRTHGISLPWTFHYLVEIIVIMYIMKPFSNNSFFF